MTANEFHQQKISNFSLAWEVYGHKVPQEEYVNFTPKELKIILELEEDEEKIEFIKSLM